MVRNELIAIGVALGVTAVLASPQQPVTRGASVTATATIQQIDAANRVVTLRMADGTEETGTVGPEVKRFNELKVGDRVNVTYYESTVYQIRRPGQPAPKPSDVATGTAGTGPSPAGTISRQIVTSVAVKAIESGRAIHHGHDGRRPDDHAEGRGQVRSIGRQGW